MKYIWFRFLLSNFLSNCLNWKIYCDDHTSLSSTTAVQIWIISYIFHMISLLGKIWTQLIDLAPNVWLHSSIGRASHRYRGGHGFESRWSPDFFYFQASSFQLLKLENLLRWSYFTFIYNRSTNMNYFIYIFTIYLMMLGRLSLLTLLSMNLNRFISRDFSTFLMATTFVPLK